MFPVYRRRVALTQEAVAATADDDNDDSWMMTLSIDFRSDELTDKRVRRTSSFFCSPSFSIVDVSPFTTDYLCAAQRHGAPETTHALTQPPDYDTFTSG